ncbi:MAG: GFA family protein [Jannaschia sp.]
MPNLSDPHPGACHCGAVRFEARLTDGMKTARRCNCSICRMRGAVAVSAPLDGFRILEGQENLVLYQFNTRVAEHWFCATCGIYTHHRRRSNPNEYGVNVACLEGWSPFDLTEVAVLNGGAHPKDATGASNFAGILRFDPD